MLTFSYTLFDIPKAYSLWQLVQQTNNLYGALLEVGVWRGGTGVLIAKQSQHGAGYSALYLCDTFLGVVTADINKDALYRNGEHADTSAEIVENLTKTFNIPNVKIMKGIFPKDSGELIEQENFKFCHIDVDVYQSTKDIFDWVWPKMIPGGMVVIDDYGYYRCNGVAAFVNEQRMSGDGVVIGNWLLGQAVIIKR